MAIKPTNFLVQQSASRSKGYPLSIVRLPLVRFRALTYISVLADISPRDSSQRDGYITWNQDS